MNNLRIHIITLSSLLCLLCLTASAQYTKTITMSFEESDFKIESDENGNVVISSTKDFAAYDEDTSALGLPYVSTNVLIGKNQTFNDFSYSIVDKVKVKSDVTVAPNPIVVPTNAVYEEPQITQQAVSYAKAKYPTTEVKFGGLHLMDGYRILCFNISPFIYDAANRDLYLIKSLTINVSLGGSTFSALKTNTNRSGSTMKNIVKELVSNKDEMEALYGGAPLLQPKGAMATNNINDKVDYLVITNALLKDRFYDFCGWKEEKGIRAEVITVDSIYAKYPGATQQLKIKNCLKDYYENRGLEYALLGGDDTVVPVMGCYGKAGANIDYNIPTDLFYACFDNNFEWNANGNDIYGEFEDDIDLAPEILLSRVPVRSETDANNYLLKVETYEQQQISNDDGIADRILMCGVQVKTSYVYNGNIYSDSNKRSDLMYDRYIGRYWDGERIRFYDTGTDFPGGSSYDCNSTNFQNQLSAGYYFVDMMSHGYEYGLGLEGDTYNIDHALALRNSKPTIITTTACLTNAFDKSEPCLSEAFIRNSENSVIAYWGCSRNGLGRSGTYLLGASEEFDGAFYESVFEDEVEASKAFAYATTAAKMKFISKCQTDSAYRWVMFGLNPLGDPELQVFSQKPKQFGNVSLRFNGENLIVDAGMDGCRICVMGGGYYGTVDDTRTGIFNGFPCGEIDVCIKKPGYVPWRYILYIESVQNETIQNSKTIENRDMFLIGSDVTSKKDFGPVVVESGGKLKIKKYKSILIKSDFEVKRGGEFIIEQVTD